MASRLRLVSCSWSRKASSETPPYAGDIAKLLHRSEFRQALEEAPDAAGIYRIIRENSGA